jgi:hypothetical protein
MTKLTKIDGGGKRRNRAKEIENLTNLSMDLAALLQEYADGGMDVRHVMGASMRTIIKNCINIGIDPNVMYKVCLENLGHSAPDAEAEDADDLTDEVLN